MNQSIPIWVGLFLLMTIPVPRESSGQGAALDQAPFLLLKDFQDSTQADSIARLLRKNGRSEGAIVGCERSLSWEPGPKEQGELLVQMVERGVDKKILYQYAMQRLDEQKKKNKDAPYWNGKTEYCGHTVVWKATDITCEDGCDIDIEVKKGPVPEWARDLFSKDEEKVSDRIPKATDYIQESPSSREERQLFHLDSIIQLPFTLLKGNTTSTLFQNHFYFLSSNNIEKEMVKIHRFSLETKKLDSLELPNSRGKMGIPLYAPLPNTSFSIAVHKDTIMIGFENKIFLYEKIDKEWKFLERIKAPSFFNQGMVLNRKVIVGHIFNEDPHTPSFLGVYDLKKDKWAHLKEKGFTLVELSQNWPHNWLSISKSGILFAQTVKYRMDILDHSLKMVDSIHHETDWKGWPDTVITKVQELRKKGSSDYHEYIQYKVYRTYKYQYDRLVSCKFITPNSIFVWRKKGNDRTTNYYDIWRKRDGNWVMTDSSTERKPEGNPILEKGNFPFMPSLFGGNFHFTPNKVVGLKLGVPGSDPIGKTFNEFHREFSRYIYSGKEKYSKIYVYRVK